MFYVDYVAINMRFKLTFKNSGNIVKGKLLLHLPLKTNQTICII